MSKLGKITDEQLLAALPHGSGIDCKWEIERKGKRIICRNSFHVMTEHGYYNGYQDFQVILFTHKEDVVRALTGPCAGQFQTVHRAGDVDMDVKSIGGWRRDSAAYGLRDFLIESFYFALHDAGIVD